MVLQIYLAELTKKRYKVIEFCYTSNSSRQKYGVTKNMVLQIYLTEITKIKYKVLEFCYTRIFSRQKTNKPYFYITKKHLFSTGKKCIPFFQQKYSITVCLSLSASFSSMHYILDPKRPLTLSMLSRHRRKPKKIPNSESAYTPREQFRHRGIPSGRRRKACT